MILRPSGIDIGDAVQYGLKTVRIEPFSYQGLQDLNRINAEFACFLLHAALKFPVKGDGPTLFFQKGSRHTYKIRIVLFFVNEENRFVKLVS